MSTGTLALTNKSSIVTGSGTSFTVDLAVNDFVVFTAGQTTYTLAVKAIVSDTELTLVKPYGGPTGALLAWQAMPVGTLVLITSEIVAQSTEALRAQNYDRYNWEQVYSQSKNITVMLSDGSTFTGPSWKQIADLLAGVDVEELQQIADDVRQDAQQVAADKATAQNASDIATEKAAETLSNANNAAEAANTATEANTAAQDAKISAADSAAAAAASASTIDTSAFLRKDDNLSGIESKPTARANLDVYSKAEVDGKGGGYVGRAFWHSLRSSIPGGNSPGDGQVVDRTGTYAALWAECAAGRLPVVTESVWLADPTKRGCYSSGDGSTTFRFPDYNGVQPGSIAAPVVRGDGGLTDGTVQQNAAPDVTWSVEGRVAANVGGLFGTVTGAAVASTPASGTNQLAAAASSGTIGDRMTILSVAASRSSDAYGRDGTKEVRGNSVVGCFVIQFAGVANNAGSIDALALATRIEQVAQSVTTTAARFDRQGVSAWVAMSVNPTTLAITILDSFNVAGVTRNTVGTYTISFATNMLSTNYGWDGSVKSSSSAIAVHNMYASLSDTKTVSQMVVRTAYATATTVGAFDPSELTVIFVGGK